MTDKFGFNISQDYTILEPKSGPAFPIPCNDWEHLKDRLRKVSIPPWVFQNLASGLAGIAVATLVNILIGMLPSRAEHPYALVIAWAIFAVTAICSAFSFGFAHQQRKMRTIYVSDVIGEMELIERRFVTIPVPVLGSASGDLLILQARYGARDHRVDVTDELNFATMDGRLHIFVGNQLGGDPCPGVPKDLVVRYKYKNLEFEKVVAEGNDLDLP